jgi:hypothetical protein
MGVRGVFVTLALVGAVLLVPAGSAAEPSKAQDVCGILPGEGGYSYVKVWNVSCKRARKVAGNAYDRFCEPIDRCATDPQGGFITGKVRLHGWKCDVKLAYEFSRVRCEKAGKRLVQESAA